MFLFGFGLLLAACSDDYKDWADPQSNPQEDLASYTLNIAAAEAIDYANVSEDSVQLFVPALNSTAQGTTTYVAYVYNADKTDSVAVNANANGYVSASELQAAMESLYGKRPVAHEVPVTVYAYTNVNGATVKGEGQTTTTVTLTAPFIDTAYWLVGDMCGWNKESALAFSHSDADVYEDPYFSITFTTTADNQYWKIIPQTNYAGDDFWAEGSTGVVGVVEDGDTSLEGSLVTAEPKAGKIEVAGTYVMTINMMDYTYTIQAVNHYWVVGGIQGWSTDAQTFLFYPQSGTVASYTTKWTGAWDLKIWDDANFGNWDTAWGCAVDGDNSASGTLINSGAQAISAPSEGYYTLTINMGNKTYEWKAIDAPTTEYSQIGVIGLNGDWNTDIVMSQAGEHNWYVKGVSATSDTEFKFRANGGWDVNWGGTPSTMGSTMFGTGIQGGDNIKIAAGTYDFYLNDITGEYCVIPQ